MRRAAKNDANASALVEYAREAGMLVEYIGLPVDLLVGYNGTWHVVEVKNEGGTYTPGQKRFLDKCSRYGLPFTTWRTVDDIDLMMGQ